MATIDESNYRKVGVKINKYFDPANSVDNVIILLQEFKELAPYGAHIDEDYGCDGPSSFSLIGWREPTEKEFLQREARNVAEKQRKELLRFKNEQAERAKYEELKAKFEK